MKKVDILVVGGGPAGLISAITAKKMNSEKKVSLVRNFENVPVPCGIPYIFHTLDGVDKNVMPDGGYNANNIELIIDEAIDGDINKKIIKLKSGELIEYDKLILATGSKPIVPKFIPGYDKQGVYVIKKDNNYLREIYEKTKDAKNIIIIGAGFIGMEIADEFLAKGCNITVIEMREHALIAAFDEEISIAIEEKFKKTGAKILTNKKVVKIGGTEKVEYVEIESGERIDADVVFSAIGAIPNTELAEKLGLKIEDKGVWVDEYLRTSNPDVFAVGDCASKTDFFTRRPVSVMLASTACSEARIAGANLYKLQVVRENKGTIGVFSSNLQGISIGTAGLTEHMARIAGFDVISTIAKTKDRHPGKFADTSDIFVKLIFSKNCGVLLGGQAMGGKSVGEMINIISVLVQQKMHAGEIYTLQIGTHPLLTSAPTTYPLIIAAQDALLKVHKK